MDVLNVIRDQADALAKAVRDGDLDAPVPSCPDWDLGALTAHTGAVHRFWKAAVEQDGEARPDVDVDAPEDPGELVTWFEDGVAALVDVLAETDDDATCWTWWGDNRVSRVKRRMAVETSLHRWDAQAATGDADALPWDLAVEGIREFLNVILPATDRQWDHDHVTVHLHRTDGRGDWSVTMDRGGGERRWARDDAAVVRAPASDLLLLLWRRISLEDVRITGDRDAVARLVGHADLE